MLCVMRCKSMQIRKEIKMADREVKKWITINGKHVPLYDKSDSTDLSSMSYNDTKDWMRENSNYNEWEDEMFDKSIDETIHNYTGERYLWINEYLRTGEFNGPKSWYQKDDVEQDIKELDEAVESFDLKKPVTVYRSSDSNLLGNEKMSYEQMRAMVGKTVSDKAYLSTSTLKELPGEQTVGGVVDYVIDVPAGKGNGAYVARYSENSSEREMLLRRGASYKINKVTKDANDFVTVYLTMVNK